MYGRAAVSTTWTPSIDRSAADEVIEDGLPTLDEVMRAQIPTRDFVGAGLLPVVEREFNKCGINVFLKPGLTMPGACLAYIAISKMRSVRLYNREKRHVRQGRRFRMPHIGDENTPVWKSGRSIQ